ncbi:hypothetical protein ACFY9F_23100 [Streptomyces sp. NPDC012421]|uniref:hypothetical protein n=1 Tax=Streptomyces sp. NPDC012421 TaxID=3364832 RepID=UPI0036F007BC
MFAAVCVLLAATGHILMSGRGVPGSALALAFAGTVAVTWALAGRERGLLAVTVASVAVQSALHEAFTWAQPAAAPAPASPTPMPHPATMPMPSGDAHAAHVHASHAAHSSAMSHASHAAMGHGDVSPSGVVFEAPAAHDMTDLSSNFGMVSAHLLAALLSGLWMAYGERAAFRLLRAASLRLFRPLCPLLASFAAVVPDRPRLRPVRAGDERAPARPLLAHSLISRGPPRALAVL